MQARRTTAQRTRCDVVLEDRCSATTLVAAWFGLRAVDRGAAAVALHVLRRRAARIIVGPLSLRDRGRGRPRR